MYFFPQVINSNTDLKDKDSSLGLQIKTLIINK